MKHKNFFIVPNQIFELGLKPKEFVVYCCLLRHSDKNTDNCFPSRRLIADECSMDKKTVDSALKELEARGLIKKLCRYRENGSRTSNMYYLVSLLEYGFICSRYRKHMGEAQCTPHSIRAKVLDEIILEEIRKVTYYARAQTREFVSFINQKSSAENRRELNAKMIELASLEKRNNELNALFRRLYEDNVLGKVTNEQFRMLSDGYNTEQREITERLPIVKQEIEDLKAAATNGRPYKQISAENFFSLPICVIMEWCRRAGACSRYDERFTPMRRRE